MAASTTRAPYNMFKCHPCRGAHAKCVPPHAAWNEQSPEKCQRCGKKGQECGGPSKVNKKRKPSALVPKSPEHSPNLGHPPSPGQDFNLFNSQENHPSIAPFQTPSPLVTTELDGANRSSVLLDIENCYAILCSYRFLNCGLQSTSKLGDAVPEIHFKNAEGVLDDLLKEIENKLTIVGYQIDQCDGLTVLTLIDCLKHVELFCSKHVEPLSGNFLTDVRLEANRRKLALLQHQVLGGEPIGRLPFYELAIYGEIHPLEACRKRDVLSRQSTPAYSASDVSSDSVGASVLNYSVDSRNSLQDWQDSTRASSYISEKSLYRKKPSTKSGSRKHRRNVSSEIPPEFVALVFGTIQQAQSWLSDLEHLVDLEDFYCRRISHVAAQFGRVHLLRDVLMEERFKSKLDCQDARRLSPAMVAIIHGNLDSLKLFIQAGYSIKGRDMLGRNLLALAALHGYLEIVKYLLSEGHFQVNDVRSSSIHAAIDADREDICKELLKHDDINLAVEFRGKDAVTYAQEKSPDRLGPLLYNHCMRMTGNSFGSFSQPSNTNLIGAIDQGISSQTPNPPHNFTPDHTFVDSATFNSYPGTYYQPYSTSQYGNDMLH